MNRDARLLEEALVSSDLSDKVDLVLSSPGVDKYRVASSSGSVNFERRRSDALVTHKGLGSSFEVTEICGNDPLAEQSISAIGSLEAEKADRASGVAGGIRTGANGGTSQTYPNAFESIAQFFDSPDAPDLYVCRSGEFDPEGNIGQHGSLGVVQARALMIGSGAGIRQSAVTTSAERTVDIAPTIAALLDLAPNSNGSHLRGQDGRVLDHILSGSGASHVVVILLDGCNTNLLREVMVSGHAPNLSALVDSGSMMEHGMVASLPTATLANHTAEITGRHPGHSGVLHHTWLKRSTGEVPDLLSFEEMFWSASHLSEGTETIFEVIATQRPGGYTTATFEFCDRGASMSTFEMVREGTGGALPDLSECRHVNPVAAQEGKYAFYSTVDHLSMDQTIAAWGQDAGNPLPILTWCSLALTDEAGHRSGPHGDLAMQAIIDSDSRVGEIVAAVDRAGSLAQTAFLVISDHGMEQADPQVSGHWHSTLSETGVAYRDIGEGLIYLM
ncbi:MAG: alkaline phosphatase family protein [Microthrixaceae bacterium]